MASIIRFRRKSVLLTLFFVIIFISAWRYYYKNAGDMTPDIGKRSDVSIDGGVAVRESRLEAAKQTKLWPDLNGPFDPRDPGEGGIAVQTKPEEEKLKNMAYAEYGFNQYISDKISLHRSLPDSRSPL